MASLYAVLSAVQTAISAAVVGLKSASPDTSGDSLNVEVGIGWPSEKTIMDNVRGGTTPTALVSVYDRGLATNTTRWLPHEIGRALTPAGITAQLSSPTIAPNGTAVISFGGTVTKGDAAALLLAPSFGDTNAQVSIAAATDTPSTLATQLAALVNADADLSKIVTAAASGSDVTLTSKSTSTLRAAVNTGNGGTRTTEIGRRARQVQVILWTRTEDDRNTAGDVIETAIADLEANFGLTFPDGSMGRVLFLGDHQMDDATLADTYRRDFILSVDYPITATDALYAVLAPVIRNTTF